MELLLPSFGLVVWTAISFLILLFVLSKFAWKSILKSISDRENFIEDSLKKASIADKKMNNLDLEIKKLLKEAQSDKLKILSEANDIKNRIISEARENAKYEANKIIELAKAELLKNQEEAIHEIKKHVAGLIVKTTEQLLKEKLKNNKDQDRIIEKALEDISIN